MRYARKKTDRKRKLTEGDGRKMRRNIAGKKIKLTIIAAVISILMLGGCGEAEQAGGTGGSLQGTPEGEAAGTSGGQEGDSRSEESSTGQSGDGQAEAESLPEGYRFQAGSVTLMPDMDIDTVLAQLGESRSVYEAPSCAGQGVSYLYDYISYEIETYPAEGGVNRIGYIILKDDTVSTSEGVDLSMTKADCIDVYGEPYEEKENKLVYVQGNTKLNFILEGEYIVSIEYASGVIG